MKIHNPIIRGFYPDPSICEAEGKYYIACSSFQYLPGVPVFESEDLVNWKQVANALTRTTQVELHKVPSSGGVFAPTLRYHEGTFYMVTNNNTFGKNFYIYTDDIKGEWSEPIFVDQEGIDPSLLFDNGKVYFTSNGNDAEGKGCILQCEIDIKTGEKLTESIPVWGGSGGRYLESPHLYHIGDWYYMMAAEGGTEYGHMITYARSRDPFGPFEGYQGNPVLTNRNLGGNQSLIQGIGHGDLIRDKKGNYYIVCLGFRQSGEWQPYHHLGREVFLAPVSWQEDGWFTAGEQGIVTEWMDVDLSGQQDMDMYQVSFENTGADDLRWSYLRDYHKENYQFIDRGLRLRGTKITLDEADTPTFAGIRQSEFHTCLNVSVSGEAKEAGITFYMDESQHYDLSLVQEKGERKAALRLRIGDAACIANTVDLPEGMEKVEFSVVSDPNRYEFYCMVDGEKKFLGSARTKYLSSEVAGGFTGVLMGLYAVDEDGKWAEFEELEWKQG
ncbi:MAG: glycoside hydrolase family 43 protein [Lachnospiraceae bacterium]|nr:glycoside hydrolase family 43 protein [Lachnospiraceae bacterium]MDE7007212.1 glycoside hydrolase family 43 protein [Lachnospiraceae bacterium]